MSTMLLESALAELSSGQPSAGHGSRGSSLPVAPLYGSPRRSPSTTLMRTAMEMERNNAHGFLPTSSNVEANIQLGLDSRAYANPHSSVEKDQWSPPNSRSISATDDRRHVPKPDLQEPPHLDNASLVSADRMRSAQRRRLHPSIGSPSVSSSPRASSEAASQSSSDAEDGGRLQSNRRQPAIYEKQISIDPHSVSYRSNPDLGETSQHPNSVRARNSTSDASTAPHSPRSISFPGKMRSYLRGRLSVPDLAQVSPFRETLSSDYSSDRSSNYSIAESPISTLDLHRSPLNVANPSPPPDCYYEAIYVPPPPPPPPRYRTLSTNGSGRRSRFSAPLPQPQRMASYKKTMSFQVRDVDDFTYGRQGRYTGSATDNVERSASMHREANVQSSRGMLPERHLSSRGMSLERRMSSRRMSMEHHLANRGMSLEHRTHSLREIIEIPRSSSADMSCCSFLPFLGSPKARVTKHPSQIQQCISPAPSQRVPSQRSFYGIALPPGDGYVNTQNVMNGQFNMSAEDDAIFREPSVMERFEYRNSTSTGEPYIAEGEGNDYGEDADANEESSKIERAQEVLLSFNEAYSPVASAFVFHPNDNLSTTGRSGDVSIARKALKGSNGTEGAGTRPAFRRVRFNLESTEEVEQEVESVISSSPSNSREMTDMVANLGPSFLPRSTTRRAWDDLLVTANNSGSQYGQLDNNNANHTTSDGDDNADVYSNPQNYVRAPSLRQQHDVDLFLTIVNGAMPSKKPSSKTPYKPMLFGPDMN